LPVEEQSDPPTELIAQGTAVPATALPPVTVALTAEQQACIPPESLVAAVNSFTASAGRPPTDQGELVAAGLLPQPIAGFAISDGAAISEMTLAGDVRCAVGTPLVQPPMEIIVAVPAPPKP
jgi:hypothetical protein